MSAKASTAASLPLILALSFAACGGQARATAGSVAEARRELPPLSDSAWATLVQSLSEPGGYFDTDNLISNERSFLHVLGPLRAHRGGAYLGVGPDQNFSYITAARPAIAFIVDIRRDNLLHHLLLRSLFAISRSRADYLAHLHGRPPPPDPRRGEERPLEEILDHIDSQPVDSAAVRATRSAVDSILRALPLPLSEADLATIRRFHRTFIEQGTGLRFESFGRTPRPGYPTFRDLLLETDASGEQGSYLAGEVDFLWLKRLQENNLVVPVVGDLAGPHSLRAIGEWLDREDVGVSAFYTSNVEYYLWGDGSFARFVGNVRVLPWLPEGLIIRSVFEPAASRVIGAFRGPGYISLQLAQPAEAFLRAAGPDNGGVPESYESVISAGTHQLGRVP